MNCKNSLVSLKLEIPVVEATKEGLLAGGFLSVNLASGSNKPNLNCPQAEGATCAGNAPAGLDINLNCPLATGATCGGSYTGTSSGTSSGNDDNSILLPKSLLM